MAIINGDATDNVITGTLADDTIIGFAGDDMLFGVGGDDTLAGSADGDHLYGGEGSDLLDGESGDDVLQGGAGADALKGGSGIDTVDYNGPAGVKVVIGGIGSGGDAQGDFVGHDVENIQGTGGFGDELTGAVGDNVLSGFGGDDKLYGLNGNDTLNGGAGDDLLVGGGGSDKLVGGAGIDTVDYGNNDSWTMIVIGGQNAGGQAWNDVIGDDIENILGSAWDDMLYGSAAANLLEGSLGNDDLGGKGGDDTLKGGHGDDGLHGGAGADVLDGGAGTDAAEYTGSAGGVSVSLATGTGTGGEAQGDTLALVENIIGSGHNDQLSGDAANNALWGVNGDDLLRGAAGADTLIGGNGVDTASYDTSLSGVTVNLTAGTASGGDAQGDTLTEIENLNGSLHNDILTGNAGANALQGDKGDDVLRGGAGADTFNGGFGFDTASYYESSDSVSVSLATGKGAGGDAQGDILMGVEKLSGSQANDGLEGNGGFNALQGWGGNDALVGGGGKDTLAGGIGADRFCFTAVGDSAVGADADVVTDFSHAQADRIDLHLIDADTNVAGDHAFSFIGTGLYTGVAGQLRYAVNGGVTTIAGDIDGDKVSDFHIQLTGAIGLVAIDFVL